MARVLLPELPPIATCGIGLTGMAKRPLFPDARHRIAQAVNRRRLLFRLVTIPVPGQCFTHIGGMRRPTCDHTMSV